MTGNPRLRWPIRTDHAFIVRPGPIGFYQEPVAAPTAVHLIIVPYSNHIAVERVAYAVDFSPQSKPEPWQLVAVQNESARQPQDAEVILVTLIISIAPMACEPRAVNEGSIVHNRLEIRQGQRFLRPAEHVMFSGDSVQRRAERECGVIQDWAIEVILVDSAVEVRYF
jgi:hypothetical protein